MGVGGKLADSPRQLLLILLSQMMASRPFSQAALNVIVRWIRQEESEATAIEAALAPINIPDNDDEEVDNS